MTRMLPRRLLAGALAPAGWLLWLLWAAAPVLAQDAPPPEAPPPAAGPGFPSPQAIAEALLAGLGRALTGWLTSPDLRGAVGTAAGELLEWGLRRVWDGLAWAFGGVNVFTSLPPAWTTELPAVALARERLAPVATGLVGLGLAASVLLAGLGTLIGRPFTSLFGRLGTILLATAGLAVAPRLIAWYFQLCNALAGAVLDPFGGLPGLERMTAVGQALSLGWVAVLYAGFALVFLFQRLKLLVIAALCCAVAPLAVAAGALPADLAQRFFRWWLTTTVGVGLVHVLQAVCLGIGANVLLQGGTAGGDSQQAMAGLVAAGSLLAAGSVPRLLLGGLAAAAGPGALIGPVLQAATLLAGVGVLGKAAGAAGGHARFAWPAVLPAPGSVSPPAGGSAPPGRELHVRSILAGPHLVPALPPPGPPPNRERDRDSGAADRQRDRPGPEPHAGRGHPGRRRRHPGLRVRQGGRQPRRRRLGQEGLGRRRRPLRRDGHRRPRPVRQPAPVRRGLSHGGRVAAEERLWHAVPRLDAPDRLWLLPAPQAKWLGAGLFSGPLVAQLLASVGGYGPTAVWGLAPVWAVWLVGLALGAVGAFWRPGGLHAGQWASVLVDWLLVPRRAVWRPGGGAGETTGGREAWAG